jgi:hypothetical protein
VQRTANDLANRLLELRSLQESVKAINSSLALDELLQRHRRERNQVLRGARCTIALVDEKREAVVTLAAAGIAHNDLWGTSFRIEARRGWMGSGKPSATIIHATNHDTRFVRVGNWPIAIGGERTAHLGEPGDRRSDSHQSSPNAFSGKR